jgi:voltage-gated potassium channel
LLVEPDSQFAGFRDALWWSVVTATTVGYGDKYPITLPGQLVALVVMILGIGLLGAITAKFADLFINLKKRRELGELAADYEGHLLVCGWCTRTPEIIKQILNETLDYKQLVLVAELERDPLPDNDLVHFVKGEIDNRQTLNKAGVKKASKAIILNQDDNDRTTVLAALTIENLNSDLYTVAEVTNRDNKIHLEDAGVDEIVVKEEINSKLLVRSSFYTGTSQLINELLSNDVGEEIYMQEILKEDVGVSFLELINKYKSSQEVMPIGLKRDNQIITNPAQDTEVNPGDKMVYIAQEKK